MKDIIANHDKLEEHKKAAEKKYKKIMSNPGLEEYIVCELKK